MKILERIDEVIEKLEEKNDNNMDKKMLKKGKYLKIVLPKGKGEPLYTNDFNAAKEMAKEYGKGTKVIDLKKEMNEYVDFYNIKDLLSVGYEVRERLMEARKVGGKEYDDFFKSMLKKWKIKSYKDLPKDKQDDFFNSVDAGWNSKKEKGKDGKK